MLLTRKITLPTLFFALALAGVLAPHILISGAVSSQSLAEQAKNAESQGYDSLAAHYYYHALKLSPGDTQLQAAYDRVMAKRRDTRMADAAKASRVEPGPKSEIPLARGNASWVHQDGRAAATALNSYNLAAPRAQRAKYVLASAGEITLQGTADLNWNADLSLILADTLLGEGRVYPVISGSSQGADAVNAAAWATLAAKLVEKIGSEDRISGLAFKFEPYSSKIFPLLAALKKKFAKPVGVALSSWDKEVFSQADFVILLADESPSAARDQISAFLKDARAANGKAFISLPSKFESFEAERKVMALSVEDDDPALLGTCVNVESEPKVWDLLKLPLERP